MKQKELGITFSTEKAETYIDLLLQSVSSDYGVNIELKDDMVNGSGELRCGVNSNFGIKIGSQMRTEKNFLHKQVNKYDFLDVVRAIYHEMRHVEQHCKLFYDKNPEEDYIIMATRQLSGERNKEYFTDLNRYNNDLSEIDAELTALTDTYRYITEHFKKENPDTLLCKLVNDKIQTCDYFIKGHYTSFDDITEAFLNHYDNAKSIQIAGYIAWALRPSQDYNPEHDECIRYLQACVRENPEEMRLLTQFNSVSDPHQKDLMIASIVCHLHPEIEYERVYPCLSEIDLSPENIFDRELPQPPEGLIKPIPKEDIERHIELSKFIHDKIVESEMRQYSDKSKSHKKEVLNESLVSERESEKTDEYGFTVSL